MRTIVLVVSSMLSAVPVQAAELPAELTLSIVHFGRGEIDEAKRLLDVAANGATEPEVLAIIARQRGIVFQVEGDRVLALREFLRALYFSPELELSAREHAGEVSRLFECARRLHERGVKGAAVAANYGEDLQRADWRCPGEEQKIATAPSPPPPPPPPPPPLETVTVLPPAPVSAPAVEEADTVWSSPWLWIAAGVAVAGATATTIALANGGQSYGGSTGVTLRLPQK